MTKKIDFEQIFTPQGMLGEVAKKPNLDFLMNIFNIPRVYSVSGFGEWNVGQHTVATAYLALYWSKFNNYSQSKRDRLVTLSLVHDIHEAVTGDILPYFKTPEVKETIESIQNSILSAFSIEEDESLKKEIKLIDLISFLYEIGQSSPRGLNEKKRELLHQMYAKQKEIVLLFAKKNKIAEEKIIAFLKEMSL